MFVSSGSCRAWPVMQFHMPYDSGGIEGSDSDMEPYPYLLAIGVDFKL